MPVRIGINGFGRIGRYAVRLLAENKNLQLVAVNARADNASLVHLLKYDSVHGKFNGELEANDDGFVLNGRQIAVTRQGPGEWTWKDHGVDIVLETTGKFTDRESCKKHLQNGAKKVVVSAPAKNPDITIVMGVNDADYDPFTHHILSNASCTTNCLAPAVKVITEACGFEHGLMTTVHSYTMSQRILDGSHKDLRRGRAACMSMLPTTTGAARAVAEVLPATKGRLDGMAIRVPTPNVSMIDLVVHTTKPTDKDALNAAFRQAAEGPLKNILGYTEEPLVSVDYNGSIYGGVVDGLCTSVMQEKMAKVIVWYDNEAGFCNQLLRLTTKVAKSLG
ncbi:type I glyceraldehyde-3-phosphate dehydrogenase [Desulfonatronum thioautotrophicum]|uniref:type I glyceraldehyde-3-phosphate dehydrogenase n=1 Tax=Desulfonatronum thioautotrophicum TaxID=617001 RepID=UPI0005EB51EC|nr:type I glyceraldehyde-3-phosphate dehydrogenase [Desulfonatronum thioautotrophicum]